MAEASLTPQQRAAVEDRGRGLLVSAAAGSGKTFVLVERLFSQVAEGANLDDFLIITYTRAAAAELRGKIAAALNKRLQDAPGDGHLRAQLLRVYRADIKTVDAFCTELLRENCHLLPEDERHRVLRPDFRVLDEQEARALRERELSRTLDRFYEDLTPGDGGTLLADTLGAGRDDAALAALVLELYGKVQAQPYPEQWLREQERRWAALPERIDETAYAPLLLRELRAKALHWSALLRSAAEEMTGEAALEKSYAPCFLTVAEGLEALAEASERGWDAARAALVSFPRLGSPRKVEDAERKARMKRLWDECKASVNRMRGWFAASSTEAAEDLRAMAPAMTALLRLTADFSRACRTEKRRRNAADFSDQEHEAIRLLAGEDGAPTELARTVRERYREIMVDEYQDTNEVQNRIFEAISKDGTNLFTVGDVKQSIYRFRLADPTIFLERYRTYPDVENAPPDVPARLILSRNFRSRSEVLDAANFVFSNILSREMGELDYGRDEALYPGATYPESGGCATEFHLLSMPRQEGEEKLRASEAEAEFVADYIKKLIDGGFPVTDGGETRPIRQEDVVILMRSPRPRLPEYRAALEARGLGVSAGEGEDCLSTVEAAAVFALLQVIDNPRQDVPLIAALRSPLFGFDADLLAALRASWREGDFYDALLHSENEKARAFLAALRELRELAGTLSVRQLLAEIYDRCNVLGVFGAMSGGRERRENLLAFADLAEGFESAGHRGLFAFVTHLRERRDAGLVASRPAGSAGGVRIMSIHKSKGLEFPVVILADLAKAFSTMDFDAPVLVHPQYGLGPVCVDMARRIRYPTAARQALERTLRREGKSEELRLLYVAMTRAKEKLVLVHTQANAASHVAGLLSSAACPALPETVEEGKCLGDWVMLPLLCRAEAEPLRELAGFSAPRLAAAEDAPWTVAVHEPTVARREDGAAVSAESEAAEGLSPDPEDLTYVYPYAGASVLPQKLTATQLKGREADGEIAENAALPPRLRSLTKPRFLAGERGLSGAERGTAVHLVMEHLDLSETDESGVRGRIEELVRRRLLTPEQGEAADAAVIARFLQSPLAARIRAGANLRREYRFSILRAARDFDPSAAAEDRVLLQGVVDCFFEEPEGVVVLDFKTDRVTAETLEERREHYRPQLEAYAAALSRILEKPVKEKLLYFFSTGDCVTV